MTIGFSNGNFYKLFSDPYERFSNEYLDRYMSGGANAIEVHCLDEKMVDYILDVKDLDLSDFSHVSFHAPALAYKDDEGSNRFLYKLELLTAKYNLKNIVFHPDTVLDWSVFIKHKKLPISIENMDGHKNFGKTVDDISSILDKYDFRLTLDLQHCFMNDNSMQSAADFQEKFKNRISEYHISGLNINEPHYPLFKTKQNTIIDALKYSELPIIIESTFEHFGDQEKEIGYIKNHLI